jgi:hypothetical protein
LVGIQEKLPGFSSMLYKRSVLDGLAKEGRKASVRFDGDQGVRSEIKSTTSRRSRTGANCSGAMREAAPTAQSG